MPKRLCLTVLALAALTLAGAPAALADTNTTVTITVQGDFASGVEWSSAGAFRDAGTVNPVRQVFGAASSPSSRWTAHEDLVFAGTAGSFTIRQEVLLNDVDPGHTVGTIHWVARGGTGLYSGIQGRGTGALTIDWEAGTIAARLTGAVALA
jgi:hypothetical protein